MNDYVVPSEVIEWAKEEIIYSLDQESQYETGYGAALMDLLDRINVVYNKEVNND